MRDHYTREIADIRPPPARQIAYAAGGENALGERQAAA